MTRPSSACQGQWRRLARFAGRLRRGSLARLATDSRGATAIIFALSAPVVLGAAGMAIDYAAWSSHARRLQDAADSAALAAARELSVSNADDRRATAIAADIVRAHLGSGFADGDATVRATVEKDRAAVKVVVDQPLALFASGILGMAAPVAQASATAALSSRRKLCVVTLEAKRPEALHARGRSQLLAKECDIHSNSVSPGGITADENSGIEAVRTCSAGGIDGKSRIAGAALADCPKIEDPLAGRLPPPVGPCKTMPKGLLAAILGPLVLTPGTYCGGLDLKTLHLVTFKPGIYVMKDGPLLIDAAAAVNGTNVGFYFTGKVPGQHAFLASPLAIVSFTAPKDGPMAGILFYEDRNAPPDRLFEIKSTLARTLLGTFYIPRGRLVIDSSGLIADHSAYTVVVARGFEVKGNPKVTFNANYQQTDIPVPKGVGPNGDTAVRLID